MVFSRPGPRTGEAPPGAISTPPKVHVAQAPVDPLAGIKPPGPPVRQIPPGRWPQGSLDWLTTVTEAPADPIPINPGGVVGLVETGQLVWFGGSVQNTATTAATLTVFDGVDAKGGQIAVHIIPASSDRQITLPRAGVLCELGLFVTVTGGVVTGTLYVAHLWKYPFTPPGE